MTQDKPKRVMLALAILLLCFPLLLPAATGADFIRGYAAAVSEREFGLKDFSLNIDGEAVTVGSGEMMEVDYRNVIAALSSIDGVKQVAIFDSRGVEVARSSAQASEPGGLCHKRRYPNTNSAFFQAAIFLSR